MENEYFLNIRMKKSDGKIDIQIEKFGNFDDFLTMLCMSLDAICTRQAQIEKKPELRADFLRKSSRRIWDMATQKHSHVESASEVILPKEVLFGKEKNDEN